MSTLEKKKQAIIVLLTDYKNIQTEYNDEILVLRKQIYDLDLLRKQIPQMKKDLSDNHQKIDNLQSIRAKLSSERNTTIETINRRASLKGITANLTNNRIKDFDDKILILSAQIFEMLEVNANVSNNILNINDYYYRPKREEKINNLTKNINGFNDGCESFKSQIKEIDSLILEEKMKVRYKNYAKEHNIQHDEYDDFDLYRQCNIKHHYKLLDGYKVHTAYLSFKSICSKIVVLQISYKLNGDIKVLGQCVCGDWYWKECYPPEDLLDFNLDSKHVYGNMSCKKMIK